MCALGVMNECGSGLVAKSDTTLWDPTDCSLPGSSVHGIPHSNWRGLLFPPPGDLPDPGILSLRLQFGRRILYHWATWAMNPCLKLFGYEWYHLFWESSASVQGTPQQEAWRPQILRQQSNSEHRRQRLNPSRTQQYSDQMIYTLETWQVLWTA